MPTSKKHWELESQVQILQGNVKELQQQLANAHKRIGELKDNTKNEELEKTKQLLQELTFELTTVRNKEQQLIQELQDNIPTVLDSRQVLKEGD
jgi:prefoldin subunit 5